MGLLGCRSRRCCPCCPGSRGGPQVSRVLTGAQWCSKTARCGPTQRRRCAVSCRWGAGLEGDGDGAGVRQSGGAAELPTRTPMPYTGKRPRFQTCHRGRRPVSVSPGAPRITRWGNQRRLRSRSRSCRRTSAGGHRASRRVAGRRLREGPRWRGATGSGPPPGGAPRGRAAVRARRPCSFSGTAEGSRTSWLSVSSRRTAWLRYSTSSCAWNGGTGSSRSRSGASSSPGRRSWMLIGGFH